MTAENLRRARRDGYGPEGGKPHRMAASAAQIDGAAIASRPPGGSTTPAPAFRMSQRSVGVGVAVAEAAVIILASLLGQMAFDAAAGIEPNDVGSALAIGSLAGILYIAIGRQVGLYSFPVLIGSLRHLGRVVATGLAVLLSVTAVLFLLKVSSHFSRGATLVFGGCMLVFCALTRMAANVLVNRAVARHAIVGRPAFLLGEAEELAAIEPDDLLRYGLSECGRAAFDPAAFTSEPEWHASVEQILAAARQSRATEFVVAAKLDGLSNLTRIEDALRISPLPVELLPNQTFRTVLARHSGARPAGVLLVPLQRAPMGAVERGLKRGVDIAGAVIGLFASLPILIVAACAIRLDSPGPVLFRQHRSGFDRHPFEICKFRTMYHQDVNGPVVQARKGDRRVTRVGRWLRRSSIDELPQLWNVLKGDMSLVGPRPHALEHDEQFGRVTGRYYLRHHMKPGITGWAQINGLRGELTGTSLIEQRVEFDIWYIKNWSMRLDFYILLKTLADVLGHDAY